MPVTENKKISQDWASFVQSINVNIEKKAAFKLQATVKVEGDKGAAGLWIRVDHSDDTNGFFDNMQDRPILSDQWGTYSIEVPMTSSIKHIVFGGICWHSGLFYFKDFKLSIQFDNQEFKQIPIENPNFEDLTHQLSIPGWKQGSRKAESIEIEEYSFHSSIDRVDNTNCLKIEGKTIIDIYANNISRINAENIGVILSSFYNLEVKLKRNVQSLTAQEVDYKQNRKTNSIGALIVHLAAVETYYQVLSFENRELNEIERDQWQIALDLGFKAQEKYKKYPIGHYLDILKVVRQKTIKELKKRNDTWLDKVPLNSIYNHHYNWLHVLEHYSYHIGQILLLKKLMTYEK